MTGKAEIHIGKEIYVHGCHFGERIDPEDPSKDVSLYLEIDEIEAKTNPDYDNVIVTVTKAHIQEYPITYCVECLKLGKRNSAIHCTTGKLGWCIDHYAQKTRQEQPDLACPQCEEGYMMSSMGDSCCSHCDYREPHVHDGSSPFRINASDPVMVSDEVKLPIFACTCMGWNTPEEHKKMRERNAEIKEQFIEKAEEGMVF
jgi:hypothetical protein